MTSVPSIVLTVVLLVLLALDWRQTIEIAEYPARWFERNPLLGKHPSVGRVTTHFTVCCWAVVPMWVWLRPEWLLRALVAWVALEVLCVVNNTRIGLKAF